MYLKPWTRNLPQSLVVLVLGHISRCHPIPAAKACLVVIPGAACVLPEFARLAPNGVLTLRNLDNRRILAPSVTPLVEVLSEQEASRHVGGFTACADITSPRWNNSLAGYQEGGLLQTQRGR
jgi:hypothetical protein